MMISYREVLKVMAEEGFYSLSDGEEISMFAVVYVIFWLVSLIIVGLIFQSVWIGLIVGFFLPPYIWVYVPKLFSKMANMIRNFVGIDND